MSPDARILLQGTLHRIPTRLPVRKLLRTIQIWGRPSASPSADWYIQRKSGCSPPRIASYSLVSSAVYDPAKGERSGNRNIFIAPLTPSGSLVWKARAINITNTAWGMRGEGKRRSSYMWWHAYYISAWSLDLLRGTTVCQMSVRYSFLVMLQILSKLRRSSPNWLAGVTRILVDVGDRDGASGRGYAPTGWWDNCWAVGWIGGKRRVLIS